jgi:hypothetical protein
MMEPTAGFGPLFRRSIVRWRGLLLPFVVAFGCRGGGGGIASG